MRLCKSGGLSVIRDWISPLQTYMDTWYEELISECEGIVTEYGFTSRWSRITGYHELGLRIVEAASKYESVYGKNLVENVAKAIKVSPRTVNYAVSFARKFPDLDLLPEGKNCNWSGIITKYLTEGEPKEKPVKTCPYCHHELP